MLKKIIFIIFIAIGVQSIAQTYTIRVTYSASSDNCHAGQFDWSLKGDGNTIDSYSVGGNSYGNVGETRTYSNVSNYSNFSLSLNAGCISLGRPGQLDCQVGTTVNRSASELILGSSMSISSCNGSVRVSFFKPNLTLRNDTGNTVCIGGQLNLQALPGTFPAEAYNWQYSTNGSSWTSISSSLTQNSGRTLNASIQEIIGSTHENYLNSNIYFRLGRGRAFSSTTTILYSSCAPLVTSLSYTPPDCVDDPIDLRVNFGRPLDTGETFGSISIINVANDMIITQKFDESMDTSNGTYLTFSNIDTSGLLNGQTFRVQYQMKRNNVLVPGFIDSSQTFTYYNKTPVTFNASGGQVSCASGQGTSTNGGITINASGGTGSYQYRINSGSWTTFSGGSVTVNRAAGNYTVEVRDSNGCTGTTTTTMPVEITQPNPLTINGSVVDASFGPGNDGSVNITVSGGSGSLSFEWTGPNGFYSQDEDISGLEPGIYYMRVGDTNGCIEYANFTVGRYEFLSVNVSDLTCGNNTTTDDDGNISARVQGGVANYRYDLLKRNTSNVYVSTGNVQTLSAAQTYTVSNLSEGFYRISVTDDAGSGRTITTDRTITAPTVFDFTTVKTDATCNGGNNGSIALTITGGTAPYTTSWTGPNGFTSSNEDLSGLSAGVYTLTLTDSRGCTPVTTSSTVVINEPPTPVSINVLSFFSPSAGNTNGSISVEAQGGSGSYTYSWNTGQNTAAISGLADGTYTVTATDSNGCTASESITLEELSVTIAVTPGEEILCNQDLGGLTANAVGGDGQYTYAWYNQNNPATIIGTNSTISGLSDGGYYVTLRDTNGTGNIVTSATYTIASPPLLSITNITTSNVNCYGGSDGTITVTATGGSGTLSYSIDNGISYQTNNSNEFTFTGLGEATYQVMVSDANGCITPVQTRTITGPATPIQVSGVETQVTIFGQNTGAVDITVSGGNGGYSYSWSGPNGFTATTQDISNLVAGTYLVTVQDTRFGSTTDNFGCTLTRSFTITEPDLLEVSIDYETPSSDLKCNGDDNARLLASVTGGTTPYTYQWLKKNAVGVFVPLSDTSELLIGADAGEYRIDITDNAGATASALFEVLQPDPLDISFIQTDINCFGEATGAIDITVTGGTAPYSYLWSNGATTQDISGLIEGSYSVTVTDANNCIFASSAIELIQPAEPVSISDVVITNLTGFETANGVIDITVAGGTPPYAYEWRVAGTATVIGTAATLENIAASTYELTIIDDNGCILTDNFEVTQPDLLVVTIDYPAMGGQILCNGDTTAILVTTVNGGVPFLEGTPDAYYEYQWYNTNNLTTVIGTADTIENLAAGTYTVTVTDANGNTAVPAQNFVVDQPDPITITVIEQQNPLCFNGSDGSITVQATGGILNSGENYTYSWSSGQSGGAITGLTAADYTVTAFDSNGCSLVSQTITLGQPAPLFIQNIDLTPPSANGAADGSAVVTVAGGTAPYTYQWYDQNDTLLSSTTNTLDNMSDGEYFVTITDVQGCQIIRRSILQTQPDPLLVTVAQINEVRCNGEANASLRAITTGGVPFLSGSPYTYQWYDSNNNPIGANGIINGLAIGTYYVIVTDANGNTTQSDPYTITEPDTLTLQLTADYMRCGDGNDWNITSLVTGGTPPYSYQWAGGYGTNPELTDVPPGIYILTVQDRRGCSIQRNITLTPPDALQVTAITTDPTCYQGSDGTIDITPVNGTPPYTYNWSNGQNSQDATGLGAGIHSVEITDSRGCITLWQYELFDPEQLIINLGEDIVLCKDQTVTLNATIDDPVATYLWQSDNGFNATTAEVTLSESGSYTVFVTTALGCVSSDTIQVTAMDTQIGADFLVSSDLFIGEPFVIVDVSNPLPDLIQWNIPEGLTIITTDDGYAELVADTPGDYQIQMTATLGACTKTFTKTITVREPAFDRDDQNKDGLLDFIIYPNPNQGDFSVNLEFASLTNIDMKLFSLASNALLQHINLYDNKTYDIPFNLQGTLPSGIYFLMLQTPNKSYVRKIVVE